MLLLQVLSSKCAIAISTSQRAFLRKSAVNTSFTTSFQLSCRTVKTRITPLSSMYSEAMESESYYTFGPYKINQREVFYSTDLSYAMVNLRPLMPGHVLVCPRREVKRFVDLTDNETSDLWLTAQKVGSKLEHHHKASSLTFAIQDGPQAGQTVPHVHIHIIPRKDGDFEKNDEIYDAIDLKEKELKQTLDLDKERKDRTLEEMAQEADEYRMLFL
ncbi:bifunctional bis(5'-adenosyl)-triphosphatase/adenylylsulfatase FHIT [Telopea speciosissima]|uniref:bifunctional bis(5'-adenosyl)-triphosphatase/adenylylsulfatase FHIT n=1 Tax=Telopea speciosissima TaxID=54955 RepID=UPI001CC58D3D|nr:bifunctional bis(5'-adenosyl)-triphosphatase/adenylylsulfatase FHIT [Telopea speciosissima]